MFKHFSPFLAKYSIYLWFLRKIIGKDIKTVLDLGCGDGLFMQSLSYKQNWQITGVDLYKDYFKRAKERGIYHKLIYGDAIKMVKGLVKQKKKYDLVFCSNLIEHIDKKQGEKLLELVENIAGKRIVFSTPTGFIHQLEIYLDHNPYQIHKSGWTESDFKKRGYFVFGVGFKPLWGEHHHIATYQNKIVILILTTVSYLLSPIIYFLPSFGSGIIGCKKLK